ncbi:MAG TPA: response regulator transcription factor [Solirubrobacteraceae bacterium]|jgi:DNA-binding NarL/FixJ family response regulator|nr:response regulator transcription factor [Solirubrobacteraceae bacterium]
MATRRVAIIEDHGALRVFLRDVLTRLDWEVTGTAGTAAAAYELVVGSTPDVAVVDLHLASAGGGDALVRRLAEAQTDTRLLVFTATSDPSELRDVLEAGADGIVLKEGGLPELLGALDAVLAGQRYVSPQLATEL